jgi:hypothetical protein
MLHFGKTVFSINVSIILIIDSGFGFSHIPLKIYPASLIAAPVVGPMANICKS